MSDFVGMVENGKNERVVFYYMGKPMKHECVISVYDTNNACMFAAKSKMLSMKKIDKWINETIKRFIDGPYKGAGAKRIEIKTTGVFTL